MWGNWQMGVSARLFDWTLPIHRHRFSPETVVVLRGRLVWEFYDELERTCTERVELSPGGPVVALNIPIGQWPL